MVTNSKRTGRKRQPRLRWYLFRLRSLFVLTAVVAIGMSWVAVTMQDQWKQRAAADAIEEAGGKAKYDVTWLGRLLRDDSLVQVGVVGLDKESITDDVLVHLEGLRQVFLLTIEGTKITDAGLVHLHGLTQLKMLSLAGTNITDAGLVHLQGLSQLSMVNLTDTGVTDAGLAHLYGLKRLGLLNLQNTKVTDEGVRKLHQALPLCYVNRGDADKAIGEIRALKRGVGP